MDEDIRSLAILPWSCLFVSRSVLSFLNSSSASSSSEQKPKQSSVTI